MVNSKQQPRFFLVYCNKGLGSKPISFLEAVWLRVEYFLELIEREGK